ncbi:MAG: large conductance mechanosensitive channel protein MscL [Saprospiraceae bacterium]|nr:large conductance mechanosensitive channel protein MscL [Saprospiraceae bacterium]MBK7810003.1 large conductance mechanosensitive channel protein MscL [Saprospiraceae bacterium]MBK9629606.1 large conductance mechanosensitive channel protein MscL [Saprospiraceae bacterium]
MFKEFREFALNGNLITIAVGLVMATAFTAVTSAFIDGLFMPLVAKIFQFGDYKQAKIVLDAAIVAPDGTIATPENALYYGTFISSVLNFVVVAFVMFMIIKGMKRVNLVSPDEQAK